MAGMISITTASRNPSKFFLIEEGIVWKSTMLGAVPNAKQSCRYKANNAIGRSMPAWRYWPASKSSELKNFCGKPVKPS